MGLQALWPSDSASHPFLMGRSISWMEKPGSIEELISSAFSLPSICSEMVSWKGHGPRASSLAVSSLTTHAHGQHFPFTSVFSPQKWDSSCCCRACSAPECQTLALEKKVCDCSRGERNLAEPVPVFCLSPERQRGDPGHSAPILMSLYVVSDSGSTALWACAAGG